jgi:mono/diheme cytochrome c family protein
MGSVRNEAVTLAQLRRIRNDSIILQTRGEYLTAFLYYSRQGEHTMRRTGSLRAVLAGLLMVVIAAAATGTAEARLAFQSSDDENCITCHTSKETLQEMAVEPEEGEELSEGEG